MKLAIIFFAVIAFVSCSNTKKQSNTAGSPNPKVFCFYYNWYGNNESDGMEIHWAHPVMKQSPSDPDMPGIPGGDNLSSNFYPSLGNYSSNDSETIATHMKMMADSRIGVVVLTWWRNSDSGLKSIPLIMDEAAKNGLKVCFHLEPYGGRCVESLREDIAGILDTYGNHPAFYRMDDKACFFIYDSYLIEPADWVRLLTPGGDLSIRNTPLDALMIGLWVKEGEEPFFKDSGFDGYYTYFGATDFTYGSSPANWKHLQEWAAGNNKIFIPSVGPGYIDTRVRPWNGKTTREREDGKYYDRMFEQAINSGAEYIAITSFNEWHEGTQIEPAKPFKCPDFDYLDYGNLKPDYYLERTAYWIEQLENHSNK